jgi:parallel beta-helix repeat protein
MTRSLAVLALLLLSSVASASVGLQSTNPSLDSIVSRGSLVSFIFIPFVNQVDEQDVTVDFSTAFATFESISSISPEMKCVTTGTAARCTRSLFPKNSQTTIKVDVRMPSDLAGGRITVTGTIKAASGSTYTWSPWVFVPHTFLVTNTNWNSDGSFSEAITQANAACKDILPCEIDFQIPAPVPSSGWFTIDPQTPFPAITARRLTIDAHTQTLFTGDTNPDGPEVRLDGSRMSFGPGINVTGGEVIRISGFEIVNWGGAGIQLSGNPSLSLRVNIFDNIIRSNFRGIMTSGAHFLYVHENIISGNLRSGVWVENGVYPAIYENTIDSNGASGVYFGPRTEFGMVDENHIWGNRDFGVAIHPNARWTEVRANSMKGNGQLGIDFGLDLMTPNVDDDSTRRVPNAPVITSATYDPLTKKTVIIGHVDLRKPADVGYFLPIVDVYASSALDAYGMAQGEKILSGHSDYGSFVSINSHTGDFVYTNNGDLTGQYISATYTRMYALGKGGVTTNALQPQPQYYENWQATSEFSNPVPVRQ